MAHAVGSTVKPTASQTLTRLVTVLLPLGLPSTFRLSVTLEIGIQLTLEMVGEVTLTVTVRTTGGTTPGTVPPATPQIPARVTFAAPNKLLLDHLGRLQPAAPRHLSFRTCAIACHTRTVASQNTRAGTSSGLSPVVLRLPTSFVRAGPKTTGSPGHS